MAKVHVHGRRLGLHVHRAAEHARRDAIRQAELEAAYNVRFVRVSAELVERDVLAAVECVRAALR